MNSVPSVAKAHPKRRAPPGSGCRSVRSLPESGSGSESGSESIPELASPLTFFGRALVRKVLPQRSPRTQRNKSFPIWYAPGRSAGRLVDGKRKNLSVNSVPSVAKAYPKRRAPAGNGCRSVRSLPESGSGSESGSESIPVLVGSWPSWSAQTSLASGVSTATIRLGYPVLNVRIPSGVPSIPRPIATPTPIKLHH